MAVTPKGISSSTVSVGSSTFHNQKDVVCLCSAPFSPLRVMPKRILPSCTISTPHSTQRHSELPHSVCTPPARKRYVQHLYHVQIHSVSQCFCPLPLLSSRRQSSCEVCCDDHGFLQTCQSRHHLPASLLESL